MGPFPALVALTLATCDAAPNLLELLTGIGTVDLDQVETPDRSVP